MVFAAEQAASPVRQASMSPVRIMIVDDSVVVRGLISRWLNEDPGLEVVAKHSNGLRAVNDVAVSKPDIIILDIEMPQMDGMTALPQLLEKWPAAKIIMASTLTRRNAEISMRALKLGAVDYIPKPESNSGVTTSADFRRELTEKVKAIAPSRRPRAFRAVPAAPEKTVSALAPAIPADGAGIALRPFSAVRPRILAIGSSTGGPQVLMDVLKDTAPVLGKLPVVVTQHMPPTFTTILAEHLAKATGCLAKEAESGEPVRPGVIYVAPGGQHMLLEGTVGAVKIRLFDGPPVNYCKPAVDPMFECVAGIYGSAALGAILTGMGHDGREGGRMIAAKGGTIIAQDEATSVVWGMPGAAARAGICSAVLPKDKIAGTLKKLIAGGRP